MITRELVAKLSDEELADASWAVSYNKHRCYSIILRIGEFGCSRCISEHDLHSHRFVGEAIGFYVGSMVREIRLFLPPLLDVVVTGAEMRGPTNA